jgi:hypothetical protein
MTQEFGLEKEKKLSLKIVQAFEDLNNIDINNKSTETELKF